MGERVTGDPLGKGPGEAGGEAEPTGTVAPRGSPPPPPAGGFGRGYKGAGGAGGERGDTMARQPALTLALLLLCAEAEGFAPCHAPALQTKVFQYR